MNHISDPPECKRTSAEGNVRAVVDLASVAQRCHRQQSEKDQVGQDLSKPGAESETLVFVDQKRRHAPLPKQLVVRAEKKIAQREGEKDE